LKGTTTRDCPTFPIIEKLTTNQIARFEEQSFETNAANLELQAVRVYPNGTTAAHILGELKKDDSSIKDEEAFYSYRLPDYRGTLASKACLTKNCMGAREPNPYWSIIWVIASRKNCHRGGTGIERGIDAGFAAATRGRAAIAVNQGTTATAAAVVMDVQMAMCWPWRLHRLSTPTILPMVFRPTRTAICRPWARKKIGRPLKTMRRINFQDGRRAGRMENG